MLHDLKDRKLFPMLSQSDISALKSYGQIVNAEDRQLLQEEGSRDRALWLVLAGRLRVFRRVGNSEELLAYHAPGQFSGDLNVLTNVASPLFIQSIGPSTLLKLECQGLRRLLADNERVSSVLLETLVHRARQTDTHLIHEEKLAALGKMAAGLAHELSNPATAAKRASKLMLEGVLETPLRMLSVDPTYSAEDREKLREFAALVTSRLQSPQLDPLEASDREQALCDWLVEHAVPRAEEMAPVFAEVGMTVEELESHALKACANLTKAMFWVEAVTRLNSLARDIERSTDRISELVAALKEYSYMDQARFQEVDIRQGLDNTLKILHHKLKHGVEVRRHYQPDLPQVCAYAGELNQVWTNLIDNAVDAMSGRGLLTIRAKSVNGVVVVEVSDTGTGIPEEIQSRIFEPFFTTKPQGRGTGLGLDITYKIVVYRHGGRIRVQSKPGETTFEVQLPIQPPRENEVIASFEENKEVQSV
jgi:signal transduction histidine kinase